MEKILVSACLLGTPCRYDGKSNEASYMEELNRYFDLVPFCPEVEGGLHVPRDPAEIRGQGVYTQNGKEVTKAYNHGAEKALRLCKLLGISIAILKEKSPACGVHQIHNGLFNGNLVQGEGFTARTLRLNGIETMNEDEGKAFLDRYLQNEAIHKEKVEASKNRQATQEKEPSPRKRFQENKFKGKKPYKKETKSFKRKDNGLKKHFEKRKTFSSRVKASQHIHQKGKDGK